jgi:hypothetical protein
MHGGFHWESMKERELGEGIKMDLTDRMGFHGLSRLRIGISSTLVNMIINLWVP